MGEDVGQLAKLIHLPTQPLSVSFEPVDLGESRAPGPSDWVLVAVLQFDPAALQRITSGAQRVAHPEAVSLARAHVRPWFPADVKGALTPAGQERYTVAGQIYAASAFARSPLSSGYFAVVGPSRRVLLYLSTR